MSKKRVEFQELGEIKPVVVALLLTQLYLVFGFVFFDLYPCDIIYGTDYDSSRGEPIPLGFVTQQSC